MRRFRESDRLILNPVPGSLAQGPIPYTLHGLITSATLNKARTLVAVVDDEEPIRKAMTRLLRSAGLDVETFPSGTEFFHSLKHHHPDCVLLDLHMPGMDGFEVLGRLEREGLHLPIIVTTGHDSAEARDRAMAARPAAYLRKPVDDGTLLDAIALASQKTTPPGAKQN